MANPSSIFGLILCALFVGCASRDASPEPFPRTWFWGFPADLARFDAMTGQPMPGLKLEGWINGVRGPTDLKGKVVVLDFFATWCPPCIEVVPKTNALYAKYREKGVEIIGVCTSETGQEKLGEFVEKHGVTYPVARDPGSATMKAWNVTTFPTYAVVDRNGIVRAVGLKQVFLEKAIERVLSE